MVTKSKEEEKKALLHVRCGETLRDDIEDIIHLTKKKTGKKISQQSLLHSWVEKSAEIEFKRLKALPNKK